MAIEPFLWGNGGRRISATEAERNRKTAEALASRYPKPQNMWEGIASVTGDIGGALLNWQADQAQEAGRQEVADALAAAQAGEDPMAYLTVLGNEWASPSQSAVANALLDRAWTKEDREAAWAREDERASEPDYQTFEQGGDIYRFNANDPESTPEMWFDGPDPATTGFRNLTSEEKAAYGIPADLPAQIGPDGKVDVIGGSGVKVDVNNMGNIPPGFTVEYDDAGNPISMAPIPGSPEDLKAKEAERKADLATDQTNKTGAIVIEDVGRAIDIIKKDPTFTTGVFGKMLSGVGGTNANSVSELVKTIKANSAFDQLQAMRAASPTGGALGAVSDTEMGLLQSAIGSLEQSQSAEQLTYNLRRVQKIYDEIVNGPNAATAGGEWTDLGNGIRIREK